MYQAKGIPTLWRYLEEIVPESIYGAVPSTVVIESYRIRPDARSLKANVGSNLQTVEAIGVVKGFANKWEARIVEQEPAIKKIAKMWVPSVKVPSNHALSHQWDAVLHGYYYLIKNGIVEPSL